MRPKISQDLAEEIDERRRRAGEPFESVVWRLLSEVEDEGDQEIAADGGRETRSVRDFFGVDESEWILLEVPFGLGGGPTIAHLMGEGGGSFCPDGPEDGKLVHPSETSSAQPCSDCKRVSGQ